MLDRPRGRVYGCSENSLDRPRGKVYGCSEVF